MPKPVKPTKPLKAAVTAKPVLSISTVNDVLPMLQHAYALDDIVWFRGHADAANWKLIPSMGRPPRSIDQEMTVFKRFTQNAHPFLPVIPRDEWEWLYLMQHYGAPTRLLDWTESPLVALYFAVANESLDSADGCVWCLQPAKLNALSGLRPKLPTDIPCFGVDPELNDYLPTKLHGLSSMSSRSPVACIAPRQFNRVYAQFGVFTITHKDQTEIDSIGNGLHAKQVLIPAARKAQIRKELVFLRVTQLHIFPELANVAKEAVRGLGP